MNDFLVLVGLVCVFVAVGLLFGPLALLLPLGALLMAIGLVRNDKEGQVSDE